MLDDGVESWISSWRELFLHSSPSRRSLLLQVRLFAFAVSRRVGGILGLLR